MRHGSLFSGVGGFDLAAEWMGWENVFHCEINPFGKKVLKYYWPKAISYDDITKTDFTIHRGTIDILTGGFPCQPYSAAGKRRGTADDRHLWPEMLRAIREIQPTWVVGENVRGLTNWNGGLVFDEVQADLEALGYEVTPFLLPACAVNAPHRRDRIWFVAYRSTGIKREKIRGRIKQTALNGNSGHGENGATSDTNNARTVNGLRSNGNGQEINEGREQQPQFELRENGGNVTDTDSSKRCKGRLYKTRPGEAERYISTRNSLINKWGTWINFPTQSPICSRNDGFSSRLVGITFPKFRNESIKAYGNAIVPQVVYQIFKAIKQYELTLNK